jgi:hypothetical protein
VLDLPKSTFCKTDLICLILEEVTMCDIKVNSVQEARDKYFGFHKFKFKILQSLSFQFFNNRVSILMFLALFLHVCGLQDFRF